MNADIEQYLKGQADMIATYVQKLGKDDPAVTACLAVLEKLRTLGGRYAAIYEFMADPSFQPLSAEFSAKMMELATKASRPAPGAAPSIPSAAQAALGYHRAFESIANTAKLPRTREVYERIFALEKESAHAGEFIAKMAAEGLFAKMATVQMIEEYSGLTAQAESVAQPTMAAHNEFVLAAAQKATSAIEIEYESMRLFELNQLELRLDRTLVNDAFDILGSAISSYLLVPSEENRAAVEAGYRFVADFYALDSETLFAIPRFMDHMRFMVEHSNKSPGSKKMTVESMTSDFKGAITVCLKGKAPVVLGPSSRRTAVLWGKTVPLEKFHEAIRHPDRPAELQT